MTFVPIQYYSALFYIVMAVLCVIYSLIYMQSESCEKLLREYSVVPAIILASVLAIYIGFRPQSWIFSDMKLYAHVYENVQVSYVLGKSEWFFSLLISTCRMLGLSSSQFFFVIALGYVGLSLGAVIYLLRENPLLAFLFVIASFSFWGYGTNGIRNGLACSMVMFAFSCALDRKWIITALLCFLALGTHRSVMLPIVAFALAYTLIRNPKTAVYCWLISILVSLVAGNFFATLVSSVGIDDRMAQYVINGANIAGESARMGFRWDFLLYSAVPVYLTWYVVEQKKIHDHIFNVLSTTYILSNAFWVLFIRAAFSNRFAYLSWFLYPLIIAYAVIRIPIWDDQDRKCGIALLMYAGFTILMFAIGKLY